MSRVRQLAQWGRIIFWQKSYQIKRSFKLTSKTSSHLFHLGYLQKGPWHFSTIDLFSLYVLFSHFRPRDATRGNSFFQMSSYARANVRITNEKNKRKIPMRASRGLKWENKMYKLKRSIQTIGGLQPISRDTDNNAAMYNCWWTNKRS